MNAIEATFKNGQIIPDGPPDWPEGCRLRIEPLPAGQAGEPPESDNPETPEQIEDWLRWYHSLEPLEFTPQEEADLARWRQQVKEYDLLKTRERTEELFP
jgi:hypothetical protein